MGQKSDYLIVGGGIIGLGLGYELAKRGGTVTILEQGEWGTEASSAAAGMLAPLKEYKDPGPILDLGMKSYEMYPAWVKELQEETGVDPHLTMDGILTVALQENEREQLFSKYNWQKEAGYDVNWVEGAELAEIEPMLSSQAQAAIFAPQEGQVHNELLIQALIIACRKRGVEMHQGIIATKLITNGAKVQGVETTAGTFYADHTMITAGAWAGTIASWLGIPLPIFPVHGQIAALSGKDIPLRRVIFGTNGYMVPKKDGRIVIGATEENTGFYKEVTAQGLAKILQGVLPYVPALRSAGFLKAWSGLRPGTADGLPIIGPLPGFEGIMLAGGHYRNGILLAPITARLMADWLMTGEKNELAAFGAERFAVQC